MIEYFAMSVSYTPVPGEWAQVFSRIVAELRTSYGLAELPGHARWVSRDPAAQVLHVLRGFEIDQRWLDNLEKVVVPAAPAGQEIWLTMRSPLRFARHTHSVDVRVKVAPRAANGPATNVELWFPTYAHTDIFHRDLSMKSFDPDAKAALMRVLLGIGKLLGAEAFAYRNATEDSLFGPPSVDVILDELHPDKVWALPERLYKIAGLLTSKVPPGHFEPDENDPPWHYRRAGYDIFDTIWLPPPLPAETT
jgi:hypothetical protein